MEVLILMGLILLNGIFAMSEIAIVTARKSRLVAMAERGKSSAAMALKLADNPTQFMSTVQIGITSIGILSGIFGEAVLAAPLSMWLQAWGVALSVADMFSTALVVVVVTYISIVLGELLPKRMGQVSAEAIACLVAKPMYILSMLTAPFVALLSSSTHALMRVLRISQSSDENVTHADIQAILAEGSNSGLIEDSEHAMVKNVFRLDERSIASLMVPRMDVTFLDLTLSLEENMNIVVGSPYSRFPLCRGSADDLIGVISAKQLLAESLANRAIDLDVLAQQAQFIPETLSAMELLEHFRNSGMPMAFVIDEYGDFKGIVTLQDVMDVVTGECMPDEELKIVPREDGSYLLDGLLSAIDLKDCLGLQTLPEEDSKSYETLNGLVMMVLGKMPQTCDVIHLGDWRLEIVDMDGKRIDKVLASRHKSTEGLSPGLYKNDE